MRRIQADDIDIFVTCHRRIDHIKFNEICSLISQLTGSLDCFKKSSVILIQGDEDYFVVERMNTDTYTLHVQYAISRQKVYKINENQTIS